MHDNCILFTASFQIVSHSRLNKWVSKFLHHLNTFSRFPLYFGAPLTEFSILFLILASDLLISAYVLRFAFPSITHLFSCSMYFCVPFIFLLCSNVACTLAMGSRVYFPTYSGMIFVFTVCNSFCNVFVSSFICSIFCILLLHCYCFFWHSFSF